MFWAYSRKRSCRLAERSRLAPHFGRGSQSVQAVRVVRLPSEVSYCG